MTIGERIHSLRKERGISQEELAGSIHVSRQAISKWEQDLAVPDTSNLLKLCTFFDVTMDDLTGEGTVDHGRRGGKKLFTRREIILAMDVLLFLICFLLTPVYQELDFRHDGSCFANPIYYVRIYPLNLLFYLACAILAVQVGKIIYDKTKEFW